MLDCFPEAMAWSWKRSIQRRMGGPRLLVVQVQKFVDQQVGVARWIPNQRAHDICPEIAEFGVFSAPLHKDSTAIAAYKGTQVGGLGAQVGKGEPILARVHVVMPDQQMVAGFLPAGQVFSELNIDGAAWVIQGVQDAAVIAGYLDFDVGQRPGLARRHHGEGVGFGSDPQVRPFPGDVRGHAIDEIDHHRRRGPVATEFGCDTQRIGGDRKGSRRVPFPLDSKTPGAGTDTSVVNSVPAEWWFRPQSRPGSAAAGLTRCDGPVGGSDRVVWRSAGHRSRRSIRGGRGTKGKTESCCVERRPRLPLRRVVAPDAGWRGRIHWPYFVGVAPQKRGPC